MRAIPLDDRSVVEPFWWRALLLERRRKLRLCIYCLRKRRRCHDSRRPYHVHSWKAHRRRQWRA